MVVAEPAPQPVRIDGRLDEAPWAAAEPGALDRAEQVHPSFRENWGGPRDLSAQVRALIEADALVLGIEVTDEAHFHEPGAAWWNGDSIEVFLDTDLVSDSSEDRYSDDDLQIFLLPFHPDLRWAVVARGPDRPYPDGGLRGVEVGRTVTADGYVVEARIPLANFRPFRPDAEGRIGFDLAINDIDAPGAEKTETYLTLSGRFDLYRLPGNFGRLDVSRRPPSVDTPPESGLGPIVWILLALGGVVALGLLTRRVALSIAARRARRSVSVATSLAVFAVLAAIASPLADWIDSGFRSERGRRANEAVSRIARAWSAYDPGASSGRLSRLATLLEQGELRVEPQYAFACIPLSPTAREGPPDAHAPGPLAYEIALEPGEQRRFPLLGLAAPGRLRVDLQIPRVGDREDGSLPAAEVRVETDDGRSVVEVAPRVGGGSVLMEADALQGGSLQRLTVRNLLPWRPLTVQALYAQRADGGWQAMPLATPSPAGVPLDIWRDRPARLVREVPHGGSIEIDLTGRSANRIWLALGVRGAYPRTAWGAEAATARVVYADGSSAPALPIVNGRDIQDDQLAYGPGAIERERVAQRWESSLRFPVLTTLHGLEVDPERGLERLVVEDHGVLDGLRVSAVTTGRRASEAPEAGAPVGLRGDLLVLPEDARTPYRGLPVVLRAPGGAAVTIGTPRGEPVQGSARLPSGEDLVVEVYPPQGRWAAWLRLWRTALFGAGVFLLACAAVIAGEALLQRTQRLQVKMLVALGTATVLPLAFLLATLANTLQQRAEQELREATVADLAAALTRLRAAPAQARELATGARDALELALPAGESAVRHLLRRTADDLRARGAFLRVPDLAEAEPSPLGNTSYVDTIGRSGLYYSPWDGLFALGVARTGLQRRYLVGLPAAALLAERPDASSGLALFGPRGEPLAAAGPGPAVRRGALDDARLDSLAQTARPLYEARAAEGPGAWASAWTLVREGDEVVGALAAWRSRRATEETRAAILRTLLLTASGAVLLVVLAGVLLVERVSRRLVRVTGAAHALAAGEFGQRVPVESSDEVGRLASSFNRMADALDTRVRQLTSLHRGAQDLAAANDSEEVARVGTGLLAQATDTRHILVIALERTTDRLETLAQLGEGAPMGVRLPESGPARRAVARQEAVVSGGSVYVPLLAAGRTVGLAVCSPAGDAASLDLPHLQAVGRQIGIALENARLYHVAVTDELTGLYSEAFFLRRLKEEVDRAAATGRPLSLLRVVIDDFRVIARRVGAATAAHLIVETASTLEQALPPRNMIARREAGELLALLVESDPAGAARLLDRVGEALRRRPFALMHGEERPTFTFKSVSYPRDGAAADILLDALFESTESWEETDSGLPTLLTLPPQLGVLLGRGASMRHALDVVARVAPTNATVLLTGETGVGKEVLADLIQANSDRRSRPYVKVNCAAIPENLLESELFGHEKGSFTGADRRRVGRFEEAHQGTLFLDEIGDLPLAMQVKLLRVLQERRITRVGGSDEIEVDARIFAATNRDLEEEVRKGTFREDLYHRLHVIELRVPPLRERRDEIPQLVEHFRRQFNRAHRLGVRAFSPDALDALYRHPWPGNIRQLKNIIERAMLMADAALVEAMHLQLPPVESPGENVGSDPRAVHVEGLTPRLERILSLARSKGGISNSDVVAGEDISARTALRELQRLVDRGLLVRIGRRRGAIYRPPA